MTPALSVEDRTVTAGGISTHYLEAGSGQPVLLLHGSGPGVSAGTNWSRTIPDLADEFRVLAPEMVGFGTTDRAPGLEYRIDTWVQHVLAFLDELALPTVRVVGNSLGGVVALHAARTWPERFSQLVLMGAPGVGMTMTPGLRALRAYTPSEAGMEDLLRVHFAFDPDLVDEQMVRARFEASAREGEAENYAAIHRGQVSRDNTPLDEDFVRAVDVPALLVHGREDQVITADVARTMSTLLPYADLHVLARCGHWAQIERADTFVTLLRDFFHHGPRRPSTKG